MTRRKIIISKYLTMLLLALLLILGVYAVAALINIPFFGADFGVPYLTAANGQVSVGSGYLYALKDYLLEGVSLVAMTTMAFMISSMMRSSALAIGIGVAALLGGSMVVALLAQLGMRLGKISDFCEHVPLPGSHRKHGVPEPDPGILCRCAGGTHGDFPAHRL